MFLISYLPSLFSFQDDISERPRMASAISSLANYSAAIPAGPSDPDAKPVVKANLGTLTGVYLPCIQNIFGVILFIRMTWIVGTAGAVQGFFVVFLGCCVVSYLALGAGKVTAYFAKRELGWPRQNIRKRVPVVDVHVS